MEPIPFDEGRLVTATAGRDRKRHFVVIGIPEEGYVLMADGDTRRLDHPKKKKTKHLRPSPVNMNDLALLREERRLKDSDIRAFLAAQGFDREQPLCKED